MDKIKIIGRWFEEKGQVHESRECQEINRIISEELEQIDERDGGWIRLYKNPNTGEYWELDHQQSEMHGGGPPSLERLSTEEVMDRYGKIFK